ncbi:hypothetical protein PG994_008892 [Apiospora phragmitis]|uniref:Uncharacterized protein n=1 Tax=Apiospora phragmitis TaxID=2905665 RepID=A0ABR1UKS1_9PEZI
METTPNGSTIALEPQSMKLAPGTLQVRILFAGGPGPKRRSSLHLPDHAIDGGPGDFADPSLRKRWIPYAVVEFENFQVALQAEFWTGYGRAEWTDKGLCCFDIGASSSSSSEVTLRLFVRSLTTCAATSRHELLGTLKINPFTQRWRSSRYQSVEFGGGAGMVELKMYRVEEEPPALEDHSWSVRQKYNGGGFLHVEREAP